MEFLESFIDAEFVKNILGEAASSDFTRTCAIFALAAFVHGRQMRKEIKAQFGLLVTVLKEDLDAQQKVLGLHAVRLDKIEERLQIKEDTK